MKKIYTLIFILFSFTHFISKAQSSLKCNELCILNIAYDTVSKKLDVTIYNGPNGSQINYPVVIVLDSNGDTIANKSGLFYFFAQIPNDTLVHDLPTTLTSLPANFTGTVIIKDTPTDSTCTFIYPMTCTVGINELAQESFTMYPNPAADNVFIKLNNDELLNSTITLFDITGRKVKEITAEENKTKIDLQEFNSGLYFITITKDGKNISKKKLMVK